MSILDTRAGKAPRMLVALGSLICMAAAWARPPDTPQVTVGANGIKQLRFDWDILPRSNYYELWFKANNGAPEVKFSESVPWRPVALTNTSTHLLDWDEVRYRVKACNPSGCGSSSLIAVKSVLPDTAGFLKSPFPLGDARFGAIVKLSADAQTLAIAAPDEANDRNTQYPEAAVYVFRRHGAAWQREAVLRPARRNIANGEGMSVSMSADGNVIVLGMPNDVYDGASGAVHVFRRSGTTWTLEQKVGPAPGSGVAFYGGAELSAAGDLLAVGRYDNDGGIDLYQHSAAGWSVSASIPGVNPAGGVDCPQLAFSGDGKAIARACKDAGAPRVEVFAAPSWARRDLIPIAFAAQDYVFSAIALDATANTLVVGNQPNWDFPPATTVFAPAVAIYRHTSGAYLRDAALTFGAWVSNTANRRSHFGDALAVSSDGNFVVIGDGVDDGAGHGVFKPPLSAGTVATGAVYVYQHKPAGGWNLRRVVKPNFLAGGIEPAASFGAALALDAGGNTLVVGHPAESTYIPNPANAQDEPNGSRSGAAWLY